MFVGIENQPGGGDENQHWSMTQPLNAVFEGGGIKGLALVGALHRAEEQGLTFDAVAGTSAGSIVAALYAAGYSAAELKNILETTNFEDLLDRPWHWLTSWWFRFGIYRGDKLYQWVFRLLRAKGVTTFSDLKHGELTIIASDLTNRKVLQFNKTKYPEMKVAEAVRMSIGIPLFFQAYRFGEALVVDGGLLSNYPVAVFSDPARRVIGFKLVSRAELEDVPMPPSGLFGFLHFLSAIVSTMMEAHDKEDERQQAWVSTVHIQTGGIPTTKFGLTADERKFLYDSGYSAAVRFLEGPGKQFVPAPAADPTEEKRVLEGALAEIDRTFETLPAVEVQEAVGSGPSSISAEHQAAFEKAEQLLISADRLCLSKDPGKLARYFAKVGRFWSTVDDYQRAIERFERAIELDPKLAEAHLGLGQTLSYRAADVPKDAARRSELLNRAETEVNGAVEILGNHNSTTLHALGWISDERGDYHAAIVLYRKARDWDRERGKLEVDPITYNLACAHVKSGELEKALVELATIIPRDENWRWVEGDPDLKALRDSPTLGKQLADMIEIAKKAKV